jgi:hypothetical protein
MLAVVVGLVGYLVFMGFCIMIPFWIWSIRKELRDIRILLSQEPPGNGR